MIRVFPISAFNDNYIWVFVNSNTHQCIVVDPGDAEPVLKGLKQHKLDLAGILVTHHHWDHTGGIKDLLNYYKIPVFGPSKETVPGCTNPLSENQLVTLPAVELHMRVLDIPGHTSGHIAYVGHGLVFCGDTLFTGGCGKIFEGTVQQMYHSLSTLASLPEDTLIYCGHEYTLANLEFAKVVEPNNINILTRIKETERQREQGLPTVPSTLQLEKLTNPFLRCHLDTVRLAAERIAHRKLNHPSDVLQVIRHWKNHFSK